MARVYKGSPSAAQLRTNIVKQSAARTKRSRMAVAKGDKTAQATEQATEQDQGNERETEHNTSDTVGLHLEQIVQEATTAPLSALGLYRSLWLTNTSAEDRTTSNIESHSKHAEIEQCLRPLLAVKLMGMHKDIRSNVSCIQSDTFEWRDALRGLRLYAIFGDSGLTVGFLKSLRDLARMRASVQDGGHDDQDLARTAHQGLTFKEAHQLLRSAAQTRHLGQGGSMGINKDEEWRPIDCRRAMEHAKEVLNMQMPPKQTKAPKLKPMHDTAQGQRSEHSREGGTSGPQGTDQSRNRQGLDAASLPTKIAASDRSNVEQRPDAGAGRDGDDRGGHGRETGGQQDDPSSAGRVAHKDDGSRYDGNDDGDECWDGGIDDGNNDLTMQHTYPDGETCGSIEYGRHADSASQLRDSQRSSEMPESPNRSRYSTFLPFSRPPSTTHTPTPQRQQRAFFPEQQRPLRSTTETSNQQRQQFDFSPSPSTDGHSSTSTPQSPSTFQLPLVQIHAGCDDNIMQFRKRKPSQSPTRLDRMPPPPHCGPVSSFQRTHLSESPASGADSTYLAGLARSFLTAFAPGCTVDAPRVSSVECIGAPKLEECVVLHDLQTTDELPSALFTTVLIPPSIHQATSLPQAGHSHASTALLSGLGWLLASVRYPDTSNAGATSVEVFSVGSLPAQTLSLVRDTLTAVLPSVLLEEVETIPASSYVTRRLPIGMDAHDEDPTGFARSLAVSIRILMNATVPQQLFVWAWVGALAATAAVGSASSRITEIVDLVELPREKPVDTHHRQRSLEAWEDQLSSGFANVDAQVKRLKARSDTLRSYEEELQVVHDDAVSATTAWSRLKSPEVDVDEHIRCCAKLLSSLEPNTGSYNVIQGQLEAYQRQKQQAQKGHPPKALRELVVWSELVLGRVCALERTCVTELQTLASSLRRKLEEGSRLLEHLP